VSVPVLLVAEINSPPSVLIPRKVIEFCSEPPPVVTYGMWMFQREINHSPLRSRANCMPPPVLVSSMFRATFMYCHCISRSSAVARSIQTVPMISGMFRRCGVGSNAMPTRVVSEDPTKWKQ
jgi:hypothetical protein